MSVVRVLVVCVCLLTSGCSRTPIASARPANESVTLTIGWPFISGQDSINGLQQATRLFSFDGLVAINRDGRPQPRLAQNWTQSPDGLSWTFQLRHNAFFHDGSPVDSEAVKASLGRTLASPARDFSPGLLDIISLDTPKPDQLVIRLRTRSAFLLDDLIVSVSKRSADGQAFGTGPYVNSSRNCLAN